MDESAWIAIRTKPDFNVWDMPFVGNGYLGVRVAYSGEGREIEDESWYSASVMCAGLFANWSRNPGIRMPCAVQLPNFLHFEPHFKGLAWRNDPWVEWDAYRQELDFRHSTVTTSYRIKLNGARVVQRVYPLRTNRHLLVQEMMVTAGDTALDFSTGSVNPLGQWKNYTQGCELTDSYAVPEADLVVHHGAITNSGLDFAYAEKILVAPSSPTHQLKAVGSNPLRPWEKGLGSVRCSCRLEAGASATIVKLTVFCDSRLVPGGQLDSFVRDEAARVDWEGLSVQRSAHESAWDAIWERVPQFDSAKLNHFTPAALHILFAGMGSGLPIGMQICGLSNLRPWMGKTFEWDQSLFVFPGLIPLLPEWTRDLVEGHLTEFAVRRNLGWDMKANGTPAFAIDWFHRATGDDVWFKAQWPRLCELMQNLEARAGFNESLDQFELKGVHPADERGPIEADNNIWTSAVNWHLVKVAIRCGEMRGENVPESWRRLDTKGFYLPFDPSRKGYFEYARWTPEGLEEVYDGHERKQADVELAYFPLELLTDRDHMRNDFDYYAPRITKWGAPEMQNGWFAAIETQIGRPERALGWLEEVGEKWIKGDFRIFTEMQSNYRGLFTTGAGDYLAGLVYGLLGTRLRRNALHFVPALCAEGLRWIEAKRIRLAGSDWSVRFDLQADGRIAYSIRELVDAEGGAGGIAGGVRDGSNGAIREASREFTGMFQGELNISLA